MVRRRGLCADKLAVRRAGDIGKADGGVAGGISAGVVVVTVPQWWGCSRGDSGGVRAVVAG